jgi:hypothetical protein
MGRSIHRLQAQQLHPSCVATCTQQCSPPPYPRVLTDGLKLLWVMSLPTVTQPGRMLLSRPNSSSRRLPCTTPPTADGDVLGT